VFKKQKLFKLRKSLFLMLCLAFNSVLLIAQNLNISTTANTACNGLPCDWQGPSILINELMISPVSGDGSMVGPGPNGGRGEWIELYNPNVCHPVDISCYYLGNHTHEGTGGFRLPNNLIVPPAGFVVVRGNAAPPVPPSRLLQNGGNVIEIIAPSEINMTGVCVTGSPGTRLWFPNAGGWFAFYDANGVPQDAVRWGPGNTADLAGNPCVPSRPGCPNAPSLASYNAIPSNLKFMASSADASNHIGQSIRRIPDGGPWAGVGNATYANCNSSCFDPGISSCTGTATVVSAPGNAPYTYAWNDPDNQTTQTALGLCQGTYSVTVTSSNGIVSTSSVTISNFVPNVNFDFNNTFCINSAPTAISGFSPTAGNNELGTFSGPGVTQNVFSPSQAGAGVHTIIYNYTNLNGCTNSAQSTVTVFPLPSLNISEIQPLCANSSPVPIVFSPNGGILSGNGVVGNMFHPEIAGPGTHNIVYTFTDINGCSNTTTRQVLVNPSPAIQFNNSNSLCIDWETQALSASPSGGIFTVNGQQSNTIDPSALGVGNHLVTYNVSNNFGCESVDSYTIVVNPLPNVLFDIPDNLCLNSLFYPFTEVTVSPSGGTITFQGPGVQGNGVLASSAGVGSHLIGMNYTDLNGCQNHTRALLVVNDIPALEIENIFSQYCISDSITNFIFLPDGGTLFGQSVLNNQFYPNQSQPGNYTLSYIFIDENACSDTLMFNVEVKDLPFVEILTPPIICVDADPVIINTVPLSGVNLLINGQPENTINPEAIGSGVQEIYLDYTDEYGCFNSTTRFIYVAPLPDFSIDLEPIEGCPPLSFLFYAETQNSSLCSWDFDDETSANTCSPLNHSYNQPGCYSPTLTVTNEFGCTSDTTLIHLICVFTQPEASFINTPEQPTLFNTEVQFQNFSDGAVQYLWQFNINNTINLNNQTHPIFSFPENSVGSYPVTLLATSSDGCVDSFTVIIVVNPDVLLYVPNTFTPNDDSMNQLWSIFIEGIIPETFSVEVFNRWGELIYESTNPLFVWDGTHEGVVVPDGTYVWKIKAIEAFSWLPRDWFGHVNVLR
jgi:gliding motility-associated-like protein